MFSYLFSQVSKDVFLQVISTIYRFNLIQDIELNRYPNLLRMIAKELESSSILIDKLPSLSEVGYLQVGSYLEDLFKSIASLERKIQRCLVLQEEIDRFDQKEISHKQDKIFLLQKEIERLQKFLEEFQQKFDFSAKR